MNEVNIPTEYAVVELPRAALEVTITAKIYLDGEVKDVQTVLDFDDVRKAISEGADYIQLDATFCLTDEGRAHAEQLIEKARGNQL